MLILFFAFIYSTPSVGLILSTIIINHLKLIIMITLFLITLVVLGLTLYLNRSSIDSGLTLFLYVVIGLILGLYLGFTIGLLIPNEVRTDTLSYELNVMGHEDGKPYYACLDDDRIYFIGGNEEPFLLKPYSFNVTIKDGSPSLTIHHRVLVDNWVNWFSLRRPVDTYTLCAPGAYVALSENLGMD